MKTKYICSYLEAGLYCVLIPVYYDNEPAPAWRKYFTGPLPECEEVLKAAPEYLNASPEENAKNRHYKRLEYLQLLEHGKKAEAAAIKAIYKF